MKVKMFNKTVSILHSVIMTISSLCGCTTVNSGQNDEVILNGTTEDTIVPKEETTQNIGDTVFASANWEKYIGDIETFVYGLLINELKYKYDVFPACVELTDGSFVYGMGYTDYSECYTNENKTVTVFEAGLLPYFGEPTISEEEFNSGLALFNTEFEDDSTGFVLSYGGNGFSEHCVAYDKYLKYGVDSEGRIFYDEQDYNRNDCDESLGSLYSYDENKYLLDTDYGNYIPISGTSLSEVIDFNELEKQINTILEEQDFNFASVDITTNAYIAQEAIKSYLLSLQEETFLGYNVDYLVEIANEIDPTECYRITSDGLIAINYDEAEGNDASVLVKWLVGSACVIVTAVGLVGAVVFIECPLLSAAAGAITGIAIETFMQVVISGKALDSVEWNRVALAAVTGAVSGFLGPYMAAQFSGAAYFLADSTLDGLLGGIEKAVAAWLDGEEGKAVIKQFGYGFALGFGLSAGFKAAGALVEKAATKLGPSLSKLSEKVFPKLTKHAKDFSSKAGSIIFSLKKIADSSPFHSQYISKKLVAKQLNRLQNEAADSLAEESINKLSNNNMYNTKGEPITKLSMKELFNSAKEGDVVGYYNLDGNIVQIIKKNGVAGIVFDSTKYQTVTLPEGMTSIRNDNFIEAAKLYKQSWIDDPSKIPETLKKAIESSGIDIEDMLPSQLKEIIQDRSNGWVMHENLDLKTIILVPRYLHDTVLGGISHMGGVALAKELKQIVARDYFDRILAALSTAFSESN